MDVYFVRHGETDGNVAHRHQHPETELNEKGKEQVTTAAYELATYNATHIICSTQVRAVQSARIIAEYCGLTPDTHPAFEELKRPDWLVGHRYTSLTTLWYIWKWFFGTKHEGGETYRDLIERIKAARTHLESLPADAKVIVVSHAVFTNIFLEHLCSDEPMTFWRACVRFWHIMRIRNATIVHIKYEPSDKKVCPWHFMSATRVIGEK